MSEVLELTFPQMFFLEKNLVDILKAENGTDKEEKNVPVAERRVDSGVKSNTMVFQGIVKLLKEKTGRETFTMNEVDNWQQTLKKHEEMKKKE